MICNSNDPAAKIQLLRAEDVASLLAVNRSTVWRLTQRVREPLPVVRISPRCTRFRLRDVERWIGRQPSNGGAR